MKRRNHKMHARYLAYGAIIAAMYAALTHLQNILIPNSASMAVQFRASEALCVLAFFTPAAVPGLTLGCALFNLSFAGALPLEAALEQAGKLLEDVPAAARRCEKSAQALKNGENLAAALAAADFLPPAESRLLSIALREGSGDRAMDDIADRLMEEAEEAMESAVAKVEPAMVLIASALVGVILLAVMLPLMNIMAVIG